MKYFIRAAKYLIYFAVLFSIIVLIVFYTSSKPEGITVFDLFKEGSGYKILGFFIVFSAVYPLLGFSRKQIYVSNFAEKEKEIIELLQNGNYIIETQTPTTLTFRLRNKFLRLMRMYEDRITIDFSENPVIIEGFRKDVLRFSRGIEYICQKETE